MKHKPRKRFGQNFLHDAGIIHQIVFAISPQSGENIVEIGPGKGALTGPIMEQTGKMNVVELDRDLIPLLEENLSGKGELTVHSADALTFDFSALSNANATSSAQQDGLQNALQNSPHDLRIIGNLPYNISTPLLFHLTRFLPYIKDMHFMLQKEVVDRIVAEPSTKAYGRLGVMLQYYCRVEKLFIVKPGAFFPAPKVDSAIVRLIPHATPPVTVKDVKIFSKVVTQCFMMRRKTLRNNLKETLSEAEIESVGINPGCRSETLSIEQFAALGNLVADKIAAEENQEN